MNLAWTLIEYRPGRYAKVAKDGTFLGTATEAEVRAWFAASKSPSGTKASEAKHDSSKGLGAAPQRTGIGPDRRDHSGSNLPAPRPDDRWSEPEVWGRPRAVPRRPQRSPGPDGPAAEPATKAPGPTSSQATDVEPEPEVAWSKPIIWGPPPTKDEVRRLGPTKRAVYSSTQAKAPEPAPTELADKVHYLESGEHLPAAEPVSTQEADHRVKSPPLQETTEGDVPEQGPLLEPAQAEIDLSFWEEASHSTEGPAQVSDAHQAAAEAAIAAREVQGAQEPSGMPETDRKETGGRKATGRRPPAAFLLPTASEGEVETTAAAAAAPSRPEKRGSPEPSGSTDGASTEDLQELELGAETRAAATEVAGLTPSELELERSREEPDTRSREPGIAAPEAAAPRQMVDELDLDDIEYEAEFLGEDEVAKSLEGPPRIERTAGLSSKPREPTVDLDLWTRSDDEDEVSDLGFREDDEADLLLDDPAEPKATDQWLWVDPRHEGGYNPATFDLVAFLGRAMKLFQEKPWTGGRKPNRLAVHPSELANGLKTQAEGLDLEVVQDPRVSGGTYWLGLGTDD